MISVQFLYVLSPSFQYLMSIRQYVSALILYHRASANSFLPWQLPYLVSHGSRVYFFILFNIFTPRIQPFSLLSLHIICIILSNYLYLVSDIFLTVLPSSIWSSITSVIHGLCFFFYSYGITTTAAPTSAPSNTYHSFSTPSHSTSSVRRSYLLLTSFVYSSLRGTCRQKWSKIQFLFFSSIIVLEDVL